MCHNSKEHTGLNSVEMDLTLKIETENQQQIQIKLIHDATKVSTSKSICRSCLLVQNPKATDQETKFSFTQLVNKNMSIGFSV